MYGHGCTWSILPRPWVNIPQDSPLVQLVRRYNCNAVSKCTLRHIYHSCVVIFFQGCILVLNIPSSNQNPSQGPCKTVCVNPSALLNCIAGVLCETDPREYVPQFVKAGKVEKFWPTGARPNEWTLRAAIDDIVTKGLVRESVVPLCFQVRMLIFSTCYTV